MVLKFFVLFPFLVGCFASIKQNTAADVSSDVTKINVKCANLKARFDPAQECAYFGHEGKGFIQTHVLTARNQINRVITAINNSVPDTLYPNRMDTRAKIYIYYRSGKVDSLCMNATMFYFFIVSTI